jgi:hypothetical protein
MDLDEGARGRLRALAEVGDVELDVGARARLQARLSAEGPGIVRRARRVRSAVRVGGACLCLGLAGAAIWLARASDAGSGAPLVASHAPAAAVPAPSKPAAPSRACETRAPIAAQHVAGRGAAPQRFELGALGTLVAEPDSELALEASEACDVRIRLTHGRLAVHAADLGGGALRVTTPSGEVSVRGTVFSVAQRAGALTVEVDEGRVEVRRANAEQSLLDAGSRLYAPADGSAATKGPLPELERAELREVLALPLRAVSVALPEPKTDEPARRAAGAREKPNAEQLVAEADALWRKGELERARERYRGAGLSNGPTAEAAWLSLARRELSIERPAAARAAVEEHRRRFPRGTLASEALGIDFRAALQQHDRAAARRLAAELQRRFPDAAQTAAASAWLHAQAQDGK